MHRKHVTWIWENTLMHRKHVTCYPFEVALKEVSFMFRTLSREISRPYVHFTGSWVGLRGALDKRLRGPHSRSGCFGEEKKMSRCCRSSYTDSSTVQPLAKSRFWLRYPCPIQIIANKTTVVQDFRSFPQSFQTNTWICLTSGHDRHLHVQSNPIQSNPIHIHHHTVKKPDWGNVVK